MNKTNKTLLILSILMMSYYGNSQNKYKVLEKARIEVADEALTELLDPKARVEILVGGHDWSEGPLWLESEKKLIFSDVPRNTIYAWSEKEGETVYLNPSGFTGEDFKGSEPGSNGLTLNNQGELVLCQHGNRQVAVMKAPLSKPETNFVPLANGYQGMKFNSPNDLVFDKAGNLYFTDPPYGLPGGTEDQGKELDFQGVYLVDAKGEVKLLDDKLTRPNGIALSPDEKTLYVANSDPERAIWMAYSLDEDRRVVAERLFFDATEWVAKEKGLPDGLKVDNAGNVFATGPGGVWIFSPQGKHLGTVKTGEATANCAFNADKSMLFMTADSLILRLEIGE